MDCERHFLKISSKDQVVKKQKKQWIPISLTLLALISGGLALNHTNASANTTSVHQKIHTYQLVDPASVLNNHNSSIDSSQVKNHNLENNINQLGHKIVQKGMNQESTHPNSSKAENESLNHDINNLKLYQSKQYNDTIFSRVDTPFNKIRIHRPVLLHSSVLLRGQRNLPRITRGTFNILAAFNQYSNKNAFIRYLINVDHQNYYITGNPYYVSFVLPSTNYRYYQNLINGILATNKNNEQFKQIGQSLDSLNAQHVIDYRVYMSLYIDIYNLQQEEHPVFISNSVNKPSTHVMRANSVRKINNKKKAHYETNQDSVATMILQKIDSINSSCQKAANYDHQAIQELNTQDYDNTNDDLKQIALNEILVNNKLVEDLNFKTKSALNDIEDPISCNLVTNALNFQTKLASDIKTNAEQILNNDVKGLI